MTLRVTTIAILFGLLTPVLAFSKETKDVQFRFANANPVTFSHEIHLNKYNNNCKICHNAIFNLKQRKRYTMAEMEKTKSCGGCHTGIKAFSVADEKYCSKCHAGKPQNFVYQVKGATEASFSHEIHNKATGGKCKSCHNGRVLTGKDRGVTMAQMEKGRTCGACHNGKGAFTVAGNCGKCHRGMKTKDITFKSKGITNALFSHDVHVAMYSCKNCHTAVFPYKAGAKHYSMKDMENGKSCGTCHNGKEAFASTGDCAKCHKNFKPADINFKTDMGQAKFSHDRHLGTFKCADCHTKRFLYVAGVKRYTMGDMEEGKSCGGCHDGKSAFTVKEFCIKCHDMK